LSCNIGRKKDLPEDKKDGAMQYLAKGMTPTICKRFVSDLQHKRTW